MAACAFAAEPSADARKAVLAAEDKWKAAVIAGDKATLESLLASDLSYTHSSAKTQTKEEFIRTPPEALPSTKASNSKIPRCASTAPRSS